MLVIKEASIHDGTEILQKNHPELNEEVYRIINEIEVDSLSRISKYLIHEEFRKHIFFSNHEVKKFQHEENFVKDRVMVNIRCESSLESDFAKMDYFYKEGIVDVAIEILPNYRDPIDLSHGEIFDKLVEKIKDKFPKVPTKIILVDIVKKETPYDEL